MTLFTSDLHLGHNNIVNLCKRPFEDVDEMDAVLIDNWNRKVKKNDVVYLTGDAVWDKRRLRFIWNSYLARKSL